MDSQAPGGGSGGGTGGGGGGSGQDYLDKALESAEKKFGKGKIDPQKARGLNEKVTDFARNTFEKVTGKKVPKKFSN